MSDENSAQGQQSDDNSMSSKSEVAQAGSLVRETADDRPFGSPSAAAAAAPARDLSPDEEQTTMNLFKIVNRKLSDLVRPVTLSYNEQELTVLSLHWNGIHCRNEQGESVIVPGEWAYLKEIFIELD